MNWQQNLISDSRQIKELLEKTRRIAVLGIKTERQAGQPAYYVPEYMHEAGFEIIPVPVYYPEITTILGRHVYRRVADVPVPPPIDLVDVFRRGDHLSSHLEDLVAAKPRAVWLQQGIRDDAFAERLARAGITVVQDRCLMMELRLRPSLRP